MGNIRYEVPEEAKFLEDYRLLYSSHSRYETDWNSCPHVHHFAELFYVADGEGTFSVEEESFPIRRNDLVIVNPNVAHTEYSSRKFPLEYIVLGVEHLHFEKKDSRQYLVFHNAENSEEKRNLDFYFRTIQAETSRQKEGYTKVCQCLLGALILILMRRTGQKAELLPTEHASRECSRARRYMDYNYKEEITLDRLAEIAGLNRYHFAHMFTRYYGQPPMNYLTQRRIAVSRELLVSTDMTVAAIASQCGFSSQSYYAQSFRRFCGESPAQYRKKQKERTAEKEKTVVSSVEKQERQRG